MADRIRMNGYTVGRKEGGMPQAGSSQCGLVKVYDCLRNRYDAASNNPSLVCHSYNLVEIMTCLGYYCVNEISTKFLRCMLNRENLRRYKIP